MDMNKLTEILRATLQPDQREEAEKQLEEVRKIISFVPSLLQIIMQEQLDMPVRQAGAVYMKNMVTQFWEEPEADATSLQPTLQFSIHENDKQAIRDNIVEAVIAAPNPIKVQLTVCVSQMVKQDYPGKWPGIAEKVLGYLQSDRHDTWLGALLCLHQLVKNFEYKNKKEDRSGLNEAMHHILPVVHHICAQLLPDASEPSVTIQKQILKVFFSLIQYYLPLELVTKDIFTSWMEIARQIMDRPVPEECGLMDEDDRPELIWWKCKKWAMHIISRSFERYGSPGNVAKEYNEFSEWYLKTFTSGILQVLMKTLDAYRQKVYVTPRVMQQIINYLTQGVAHSHSWKLMKPHMTTIVQDVIFPLMCHSDEDEDLWQSDPVEYIRLKYDVYEEFFNPACAAQALLEAAVSKRKELLQKTMGFIMSVLTTPELGPRQKSGALNMVGALSSVLLVKKIYKDQVELMLMTHVLPEFGSEFGYLRARGCWVVKRFSEVKFRDNNNLKVVIDMLRNLLTNDKELPVRIEAAISLQMMLGEQKPAKDLIQPHVQQVILDLLNLIRETENDDLTNVLQKIICCYDQEIAPLALEIITHLAQTFAKVVGEESDQSDDKAIAAMGILNTLETICTVLDEKPEILLSVEPVVLEVVGLIMKNDVVEFYEEMMSLVYCLTTPQISANMWTLLPMLHALFKKDNIDYFTDMMPALHNYMTVDVEGFLANPMNLTCILDMCHTVLHGDAGEDAECHAAKLLEVLLLQYKGRIDNILPALIELAFTRLSREIRTTELRTMCLQVIIAAVLYNPPSMLSYLSTLRHPSAPDQAVLPYFIKQWISDADCFLGLHDRRVCVLGLCCMMSQLEGRPDVISEVGSQFLPSLIILFKGLKRAYESRDKDDDDDDDDEDGAGDDIEELEDDDDVIDNDGDKYMESIEKSGDGDDDDDDDDYEDDDDDEETSLEVYETPLDKDDCLIDEYQIFKSTLQHIQQADAMWYQQLVAGLADEQRKDVEEVFRLADQRKAAAESKKIEQAGGYNFTQVNVPTSFNFSSPK